MSEPTPEELAARAESFGLYRPPAEPTHDQYTAEDKAKRRDRTADAFLAREASTRPESYGRMMEREQNARARHLSVELADAITAVLGQRRAERRVVLVRALEGLAEGDGIEFSHEVKRALAVVQQRRGALAVAEVDT